MVPTGSRDSVGDAAAVMFHLIPQKRKKLFRPLVNAQRCGGHVMVRRTRWECGYCGNFGEISSLQPSEKAKLVHAAAPSVRLSITVTDASDEEEPPRSFFRAELEDMVRRWDFSEDEWACRDLLIAAFPEAVSRWTAEGLENMDTPDLLSETGEKDPEAAIDMMKLLLDTVGDKLQEREVAYQFLGWDMDGLLRDQFVQGPLLQRLKTDDRLARQIFQCACWDTGQKMLYEACDWFGESELKKKLQGLAEKNPYFDGFD